MAMDGGASTIVLWAQVRSHAPIMWIDSQGYLRHSSSGNSAGKIILGDVTNAFLRALGPSDPPLLMSELKFDEQRWSIEVMAFGTRISIVSKPYWGFGIFTKCFLNRIVIEGKKDVTNRIIYDVLSSLGYNPWEPVFKRAYEKHTGLNVSNQAKIWQSCQREAEESMREVLREVVSFSEGIDEFDGRGFERDIEEARMALDDRNGQAFERAISRASGRINMERDNQWSILGDDDEIPFVDLTD